MAGSRLAYFWLVADTSLFPFSFQSRGTYKRFWRGTRSLYERYPQRDSDRPASYCSRSFLFPPMPAIKHAKSFRGICLAFMEVLLARSLGTPNEVGEVPRASLGRITSNLKPRKIFPGDKESRGVPRNMRWKGAEDLFLVDSCGGATGNWCQVLISVERGGVGFVLLMVLATVWC